MGPLERRAILGVRVDATSYADSTRRIVEWARRGESRYICLGVVASIVEALDSPAYRAVLDRADLVTPDGMPLVWMLRLLGVQEAIRVYGPDLMCAVLKRVETSGIPVGLYGSSPIVIDRLLQRVHRSFPRVIIRYSKAPPFRALTPHEDKETVQAINTSGVRILFVGLGGSKQDLWMAEHCGRVNAVMLGVGAAFDFLAGTKPQAPPWMQRRGLEWLYRLSTEPRRLWRRYLLQNPRFIVLALAQLLRARNS